MNSFAVAIAIFALIGAVVAFYAPGAAVALVILAIGALALFGPRAE